MRYIQIPDYQECWLLDDAAREATVAHGPCVERCRLISCFGRPMMHHEPHDALNDAVPYDEAVAYVEIASALGKVVATKEV